MNEDWKRKYKTSVFQCCNTISDQSSQDDAVDAKQAEKHVRKTKICLRIVFLKIEEIDTVKEQFRSDIFLQAKWREPRIDGMNPQSVEINQYWNPKLHFENSKNNPITSTRLSVELDDNRKAFIVEKRRIHADFSENLELEDFPFDVQSLSVLVSSEFPDSDVELVEDPEEASSLNTDSFAQAQVWTLMDFVEVEQKPLDNKFSLDSCKRAGIFFRCCARRRSGFFVWNNFLLMALITAMSFTIFSVNRDDPGKRLQLTFILVLTGMAFKFVVSKSLPKISYLTHLDKYIICSMVFLFVVCVWHGLVPLFNYDIYMSQKADLYALLFFAFMFGFAHILFVAVITGRGYNKRKYSRQKQTAYQKKINNIKFQREYKKKQINSGVAYKRKLTPIHRQLN